MNSKLTLLISRDKKVIDTIYAKILVIIEVYVPRPTAKLGMEESVLKLTPPKFFVQPAAHNPTP